MASEFSALQNNWKKHNPLRLAKDPQKWFANDSVMLVATSEPCKAAKNPLVIRGYYVYEYETGDEKLIRYTWQIGSLILVYFS